MYEIYDKATGERVATTENEDAAEDFRDFGLYRVTESIEETDK